MKSSFTSASEGYIGYLWGLPEREGRQPHARFHIVYSQPIHLGSEVEQGPGCLQGAHMDGRKTSIAQGAKGLYWPPGPCTFSSGDVSTLEKLRNFLGGACSNMASPPLPQRTQSTKGNCYILKKCGSSSSMRSSLFCFTFRWSGVLPLRMFF